MYSLFHGKMQFISLKGVFWHKIEYPETKDKMRLRNLKKDLLIVYTISQSQEGTAELHLRLES